MWNRHWSGSEAPALCCRRSSVRSLVRLRFVDPGWRLDEPTWYPDQGRCQLALRMQGVSASFAAMRSSVSSAMPVTSTSTWNTPVMQTSPRTLRGTTLRFWKRSSTRTSAVGSASATTRRRSRDNSSRDIKPVPHIRGGLSPYLFNPAFNEGRVGNEPAHVHGWFHVDWDYAGFGAGPHGGWRQLPILDQRRTTRTHEKR